jgi:hypothetical protein
MYLRRNDADPLTGDSKNRFNVLPELLTLFTLLTLFPYRSHANVYATNIRLNGGITNIVIPAGTNMAIGYALNEPATLGVTINISSGATTVRTFTLASPDPGTSQGSNYVVWDGRNNASNTVPGGVYSVSITAASSGYTNWTETSSETNDFEYHVWEPRGIAVNRNTNSPYYGRVFVANANDGIDTTNHLGDRIGILKLNADGTYASDGGFSDGGYDWSHGSQIPPAFPGHSPWKLEVGPDDRLYVNDFYYYNGLIFSFDQLVSSNSLTAVLRADNYPTASVVYFDGPFISGSPGNIQVWMADSAGSVAGSGAGIHRWNLTPAGIIATNDTGLTIVQPGVATGLDSSPRDVALDSSNHIYTIQDGQQGDLSWRVLRFPAYTSFAETQAEWRIGSGDDSMGGAEGIAVDPSSTYVAVAFEGYNNTTMNPKNGSAGVFYASNGAPVMTFAAGDEHHDVAWDNVGNLYAVEGPDYPLPLVGFGGRWRSYSPPGTNQATTVAVATVQVTVPTLPVLSNPSYNGGQFQFTLTGEANASYIILSSTNLVNWLPVGTNTSALALRQITNNVSSNRRFFRARLGP